MKCTFSDIEDAFNFVGSGPMCEREAVLNTETGELYYQSDMSGIDEFLEDVDDDKYIYIRHKNELNLGRDLVFRFVAQTIPEKLDNVERIFRRRGAYSRYKDLLDRVGQLEQWYEFELEAQNKALKEWCKESEIDITA